jgi:hypothetical protein
MIVELSLIVIVGSNHPAPRIVFISALSFLRNHSRGACFFEGFGDRPQRKSNGLYLIFTKMILQDKTLYKLRVFMFNLVLFHTSPHHSFTNKRNLIHYMK